MFFSKHISRLLNKLAGFLHDYVDLQELQGIGDFFFQDRSKYPDILQPPKINVLYFTLWCFSVETHLDM